VIIEGGPHRGAPAVVSAVVARAAEAIVLAFPLPLALPLAFATVVGVWGRRGRATGGHSGSYRGGRGGSSCCGRCPPPKGAE
jgi:hypothetical protein